MNVPLRKIVALLALVTASVGTVQAAELPKPDLKPLLGDMRRLVEKHYPKAVIGLKDDTIHFEFQTRKFMIHNKARAANIWQDANEKSGPQPGGIECDIELRKGTYFGTAAVPQEFDEHYFTLYLAAPYSKTLDHHLYIHLKYPDDASKEFLREFRELTDRFGMQP